MKKMNQILSIAIIATTISLASQANAQFKVNEADGIAASPKVRQMLNERKLSTRPSAMVLKNQAATTVASAGFRSADNNGIAASPRIRQMLDDLKRNPAVIPVYPVGASVGYQPTGTDGITASPRLRQQLNERSATIMVAPVK